MRLKRNVSSPVFFLSCAWDESSPLETGAEAVVSGVRIHALAHRQRPALSAAPRHRVGLGTCTVDLYPR